MRSINTMPKTLVEKLGIKPHASIALFNPPDSYFELLLDLPDELTYASDTKGLVDFIHYFSTDSSQLAKDFSLLKAMLKPVGTLWISWPKAGSKIPTDLHENLIREVGLQAGFIAVNVIALDADWSGLKFVYRLKDR